MLGVIDGHPWFFFLKQNKEGRRKGMRRRKLNGNKNRKNAQPRNEEQEDEVPEE